MPSYRTVLDPEAAFGSPGLEIFEYVATFYLRVIDDVEVGSKVRILTGVAGTYQNETKPMKWHG